MLFRNAFLNLQRRVEISVDVREIVLRLHKGKRYSNLSIKQLTINRLQRTDSAVNSNDCVFQSVLGMDGYLHIFSGCSSATGGVGTPSFAPSVLKWGNSWSD